MKNRIKAVRQNTGLTQQEFARRIGVSRNTIATYETSERTPIDAIVRSLCHEFNISETWLRTGQGDMYIETTPDITLSKWFGQVLREDASSFKKRLILALSKLDDSDWKVLEKFIHFLSAPDSDLSLIHI